MKSQQLNSLNPSRNYEVIGNVDISSSDEIRQKVVDAHAAQPGWAKLDFKGRNEILEQLFQEFKKRKDEIGTMVSQEMGMPASIRDKVDLTDAGLVYMRGYLDFAEQWLAPQKIYEDNKEIHYMFFEPRGVVASSVPWNFPFCNFIWGVMQNLVVGNTVIFKHSEECPLTGKLLEDIIQSVGLPKGVFNQVYGDGSSVGEVIMNSQIDMIYFTGSTKVGKHLYQIAASKLIPVVLELGGSAPAIVFEDADLDNTIELLYFNRYANSGQTCDGLKRLIVHKSIINKVVDKLKKLLESKKVGDAQDPKTDIGPLVAERQLVALESQVEDAIKKGAKVIIGGKRPSGLSGAYYEPTILVDVTKDMRVWKEEVFGPVLPVVSFNTEEEAIDLANDTEYGLGGYIYTQNKERAMRVARFMKTGNIAINDSYYNKAQDPFGGYKNSGIGREHGKAGLREFCNIKTITIQK